jgi:hypothetical protein
VEIRCPRCGSTCTQDSQKPNEYICTHCKTVFRFIDTSQPIITTDVRVRNCVFCGKPIETGKGFKCTMCGREYFCDSCVDEVNGKYVCVECIAKSNQNCLYCKKYAVYKCVKCNKRACKQHPHEVHFTEVINGPVLFCSTCQSFVCLDCVKRSFFGAYRCPKCDTPLIVYAQYQ